jgi:hypothetical protein
MNYLNRPLKLMKEAMMVRLARMMATATEVMVAACVIGSRVLVGVALYQPISVERRAGPPPSQPIATFAAPSQQFSANQSETSSRKYNK